MTQSFGKGRCKFKLTIIFACLFVLTRRSFCLEKANLGAILIKCFLNIVEMIELSRIDMRKSLRVLILEDSPDDAELLTIALQQAGYDLVYERVDNAITMTKALQRQKWDIVLADYSMPHFNVFSALRLLRERQLDVPFIVISGKVSEEIVVAAMKAGAHDCILKGKLTRLVPAIERELKEAELRAERRQAIAKLKYLALYDNLTGLPNTTLFLKHLSQLITQQQPPHICNVIPLHYSPDKYSPDKSPDKSDSLESPSGLEHQPAVGFAILYIDLDRYQIIKYSLGHVLADQLVAATARRLKKCLGNDIEIARIGADEFAILLPKIQEVSEAIAVAERIHQAMEAPFHLSDQSMVFSTASIGIVMSHIGYQTPEEFLTAADAAMHHAKLQGQGKTALFEPQMQSSAIESLQLQVDLQNAIQLENLHLNYQPIVCLKTGKIKGFEALVRWKHPRLGMISPSKFIHIAEKTGLIIPLGKWVLTEVCHQLSIWQKKFPIAESMTISVNLSAMQLAAPDWLLEIDDLLAGYALKGANLKLEITESVLMENAGRATAILEQLKTKEVQVSIDDFGTGYSSLSYLHYLPVDTLKIDRSFVSNMEIQPKNATLVKSIVTLAHNLGLDVIAEGVETPKQMAILRSLGCEYGQGYLFSRPMDPEAIDFLLNNLSEQSQQWQKSS